MNNCPPMTEHRKFLGEYLCTNRVKPFVEMSPRLCKTPYLMFVSKSLQFTS